jgi:hypothetical protein
MAENETTIHAVNPEFEAVHSDAKYANVIYSGADSAREHRVAATNTPTEGVNPGRVAFNAKLNPNEILDRCVMVEFEIKATIKGAHVAPNNNGEHHSQRLTAFVWRLIRSNVALKISM